MESLLLVFQRWFEGLRVEGFGFKGLGFKDLGVYRVSLVRLQPLIKNFDWRDPASNTTEHMLSNSLRYLKMVTTYEGKIIQHHSRAHFEG